MGNTVREVDSGLAVVVIVVSILGMGAGVVAFRGGGRLYDQGGRGAFSLDRDPATGPPVDSPAARAEAAEEIRQLVEAKSARRVARGEAPLDGDAELSALTAPQEPAVDQSLREQVRQIVMARNHRRVARGKEPLDVETEVERQLRH